jgi:transposase
MPEWSVFISTLLRLTFFLSNSCFERTKQELIWQRTVLEGSPMPLANTRDLTDTQWDELDDLIPEPIRRRDGRGRPWRDRRAVLNGILWVLRTGAPLADVPERYPTYQTCHRRFQQWVRSGVMKGVIEVLALDLKIRGALDVEEAFIDGSFAPAKKGAPKLGKQNVEREPKSWRPQIAMVFPLRCASKALRLTK